MKPLVFSQGCELAVTFPTLTAFIGFLPSMDSLVSVKFCSTIEGLLTFGTFIEFLTGMNSLMYGEG